jgi:tRNA A-37 threonylcarbamoyl transferase component Bud32
MGQTRMKNVRRIIHGHDGPVEIDETRLRVEKIYLVPDHDTAVEMVEREVEHASRLHEALAACAGLACPKIIAWDLSPPPRVIMGLCPGEPLAGFLARIRRRDPRSAAIARKIHDGLEIYTRVFNEPYYDLGFQNMLYDDETGLLTFLDFGIPNRTDKSVRNAPLEASLGHLIGCACYHMVRPSQLFAPTEGYRQVLRAVLAAFENRLSRRQLLDSAHATFLRLTDCGTAARRNYYRTIGAAVSNMHLKRVFA